MCQGLRVKPEISSHKGQKAISHQAVLSSPSAFSPAVHPRLVPRH